MEVKRIDEYSKRAKMAMKNPSEENFKGFGAVQGFYEQARKEITNIDPFKVLDRSIILAKKEGDYIAQVTLEKYLEISKENIL